MKNNQSVMNNKKQSVMSNEQSLFVYLYEQIGSKTKSLNSSEFNDIEISVNKYGKFETNSDNVFVNNTLFQINWLSEQLSILLVQYNK